MDTHDNTERATWPLIDRRKPDAVCEEMHAALEKTSERVAKLERKCEDMATAFVRDDLGGPDFAGHRAAHLEQKIAAERMGELKQSGAKKIIDMVLAFLFGVLTLGAISWLKNPK